MNFKVRKQNKRLRVSLKNILNVALQLSPSVTAAVAYMVEEVTYRPVIMLVWDFGEFVWPV